MLTGLRLRTSLICSDQQDGRVHHCRSCQHSSHENLVTRAVDKGDVSHQEQRFSSLWAYCIVLLVRAECEVGMLVVAVETLVEFGIGITQFDGDVSNLLLQVSYSLQN